MCLSGDFHVCPYVWCDSLRWHSKKCGSWSLTGWPALPVNDINAVLTSNNQCCYSGLCLIPRNRRSKHGWTAHNWAEVHHSAQCYSLNNWIPHWCKVSSFNWTTLVQGTLDITGYEYDFIWLHTAYSIIIQWQDTTQVYNSGVTDGDAGMRTSPLQAKCKNWAFVLHIFWYSVLFWFSVKLLLFASLDVVFRLFRVLKWKPTCWCIFISKLFLNVGEGPPAVVSGPLSATFPTWLKPLATQLVYNLIFLNNFLIGYTKSAYNQSGFSNATYTTASLPRQMLTTKLFTMHFPMVGFSKLWVVWRSISLTN